MFILRLLISIPLIIATLVVAFVNNDLVGISLWPFVLHIDVPLSVVILFLIILGYVWGRFCAWISYGSVRKELRTYRRQNKKLSIVQEKLAKEVDGLNADIEIMKAEELKRNPRPSLKERISKIFTKKRED